MPRISETITIIAQNMFTGWYRLNGRFNLKIHGLATSTITFQRSPDGGVTIYDEVAFSAATDNGILTDSIGDSNDVYRVGCKTGNYGSDTVIVTLEA